MKAAVEDVRLAVTDNALAESFRGAIDALDSNTGLAIDEHVTQFQSATFNDNWTPSDDAPEYGMGDFDMSAEANVAAEVTAERTTLPSVCDAVYVHWPLDKDFYPDTVSSLDGGQHDITYDDG